MARRIDVGAARALRREAKRVVDHAARDLVPAGEAGEDRQPGGIGGRPARMPEVIRAKAPGRTRAGRPAVARVAQVVQLVEPARALVHQDRVPVARRLRASLDVDVPRDRVADAVGLVGVLERDAMEGRRSRHHVERDPDRTAVPLAGAEVGVDRCVEPDRGDQLGGVGGDGKLVDALVPRVVRREDRAMPRGGEAQRVRRRPGEEQEREGGRNRCHQGLHGLSIG